MEDIFVAQRDLAKYFQSLHNYESAIERFKEATETAKSSKTNIIVEALYNLAFALEENG
jgi:outer membrane protein assembly factor BamD (BamD/ComL family)